MRIISLEEMLKKLCYMIRGGMFMLSGKPHLSSVDNIWGVQVMMVIRWFCN